MFRRWTSQESFLMCLIITVAHHSILSAADLSHDVYGRFRRQSSCKQNEEKCVNGECIPSYNLCDGTKDCSDGSDETRTACRKINERCPSLAFQCAYGACIDSSLKCNNKIDCADGSDEQACPNPSSVSSTNSSCGSGKFQCANGECVSQYSSCDGVKDCKDGSDETRSLCSTVKCPAGSFQCSYGACIEQTLKCNQVADCPDESDELGCPNTVSSGPVYSTGSSYPVAGSGSSYPVAGSQGSCVLPPQPHHGVYVGAQCTPGDARTACRNFPNTPVPPNWLLKYSCNQDYDLTSHDSEYSVCENGVWKNPLNCIKLCPPLKSLSVDVRCFYNGREVPCERPMRPNTTATVNCKQHYTLSYNPEYDSLLCLNSGEWHYKLYYCTPDCGISTRVDGSQLNTVDPLVLGGVPAKLGEYPWLTALFMKNETAQWEQQCGGTLITAHIVLTAAHCLDKHGIVIQPRNIKVGLGKYYRNYYKYENYSIIADVKEVVIPRFYSGANSYYALDIGLLDLAVSVQVTAFIMPACVNWKNNIPLNTGDIGHVAGWGTTENGLSSETVLSANLQYIDNAACIKRVRLAAKRLVTHDKFCAGDINGGQVDKGDSGGGITIVRNNLHFVFGVVSTKITDELSISLFTDLTNAEHHKWLDEQKTRLHLQHFET